MATSNLEYKGEPMNVEIREDCDSVVSRIETSSGLDEPRKSMLIRNIKRAAHCTNGEQDKIQGIAEVLYYHVADHVLDRLDCGGHPVSQDRFERRVAALTRFAKVGGWPVCTFGSVVAVAAMLKPEIASAIAKCALILAGN